MFMIVGHASLLHFCSLNYINVCRYLHFVIPLHFAKSAANTKHIINEANYVQDESEKNKPLKLLFIFQQCVQILEWNFTQLFNNKIYTLAPTFIEIYLK